MQRRAGRLDTHALAQIGLDQLAHPGNQLTLGLQQLEGLQRPRLDHLLEVDIGALNGPVQEIRRQVQAIVRAVKAQVFPKDFGVWPQILRRRPLELTGQRPQRLTTQGLAPAQQRAHAAFDGRLGIATTRHKSEGQDQRGVAVVAAPLLRRVHQRTVALEHLQRLAQLGALEQPAGEQPTHGRIEGLPDSHADGRYRWFIARCHLPQRQQQPLIETLLLHRQRHRAAIDQGRTIQAGRVQLRLTGHTQFQQLVIQVQHGDAGNGGGPAHRATLPANEFSRGL